MTHGHELRWRGIAGRKRGAKGKNWVTCNIIINKIYFKKKKCGIDHPRWTLQTSH